MQMLVRYFCYNCGLFIRNRQSNFHLTSCGHIYCYKCVAQAVRKCGKCGSVNNRTINLKEPLDPLISNYFASPTTFYEKALQTTRFHEEQWNIRFKKMELCDAKYQKLKRIFLENHRRKEKIKEIYVKLKKQFYMLKEISRRSTLSQSKQHQYQAYPSQMNQSNYQNNYSHNFFEQNFEHCKKSNVMFKEPLSTHQRSEGLSGYFSSSRINLDSLNLNRH